MARVDADRNLLLGILAAQMDFVSRDALFEAMIAWTVKKETPLGALLVVRGELAQSRRDLLEALVDEHVRAHGGDPARSLQALSSVGPVAEELGRLSDVDIQASVAHLRSRGTIQPPADPFKTHPPESLGEPTSWNGRFRIVRPHAHGGLGVVSVALDDELDREVAFKEIKDEKADDRGSRAQFVLEAEITGKLEHPGIIPIYGLGHDPVGRPFYAMRFIRGDSLADAINRFHDPNGPYVDPTKRSLQLRELLGRFLDVCDALAYAHSRGVLHRDLKPGNVMLGPFGETLIVDWGLALPLERVPEGHESNEGAVKPTKTDSASLPREQGKVIGTPAYMPPEQAEGAIDRLGPRSDVYGLGAILHDLLTGKRPIDGTSLEEILKRVGHGDIKPPRQVRPEVPAALEAICLKALALRPEDRYPAPRALAADIKAWLADEPVAARGEPFAERARRWAKRNRTAVTAAAVALLVGLVGLGGIAAVLTASNIALNTQRRRAEDREAQAIDAVKKFRDSVAEEPELKNNPRLDVLRKRLLKEPLAFFRALRDRLQVDRDTRPESLARLAQASYDLGQLTNEIGDKRDALRSHREALAIRQGLAAANPTANQFQSDLASSQFDIGVLLKDTGSQAEALKVFESALAVQQKLADANPTDNQFQSRLATTHGNIGVVLKNTGRMDEAMKAYKSALEIQQRLADANPTVNQFQSDLSASHGNIGNLLHNSGMLTEALKAFESALAIQQRLADANPTVNQFQSRLAASHNNIGLLLYAMGNPAEALKAFESALAIKKKLADANPTVNQFQMELATSYNNIGSLIGSLLRVYDMPAKALKAFESALAIQQRLADANPADNQFQSDLALSHNNIGNLLSETGRPAEALRAYESALAIQRKLADANPAVSQIQSELALSHYNVGMLLNATGKPAEASKAYESALVIWQELARDHPESHEFASRMGGILSSLAVIDLNAKRFPEARVRLRDGVEWQRKALASNPTNPTYRQFLVAHLYYLIDAARGLGNSEDVAEAERELAKLRDSDPAMLALDTRLSAILRGDQEPRDNRERLQLAQRAYDKALHFAAAKLFADALDADPKLAENRQAQTRYNAACAATLAGCGQGKDSPAPDDAAKAKLRDQARAWLQAELTAWAKLVESDNAAARQVVAKTLEHWREDSDLAGLHDAKALEVLPDAERKAWRNLWADVDALLAKAKNAAGPAGKK
jgi:eukaryotic-like serine/threonine-protein kinase